MMVDTIKFSEFNDGGDLSNNEITVGLGSGVNSKFNNPWTFLAPGTTGMRPAPVAGIYYRLRFNTTLEVYEYYDPTTTTWTQLSGSGTGTVNPGLANDLAFYAVSGQIISPINGAPDAVLVTNALGVPSLSTTLPSGLSIPGATITGSTAALSAGSVTAAPVAGNDLANKTYVDGVVGGAVQSITGTANQIIASSPTGNVTLSLPQDIATGSTPTFLGLTLTTTPLGISSGGTNRSTLPTVATASSYAAWDANVNLSANNFQPNYNTTVTAAGITVLTAASAYYQFFTGSTTQTITLPVASTLITGHSFYIVNNSSGTITVQSSGGNNVQVMVAGTSALITCILNSGTTAASWFSDYAFNGGSGSGTVNSGGINELAYYQAAGVAVSGLATANNGVLVTSAGGVPSISSTLPAGLTIPTPKIAQINDPTFNLPVLSLNSLSGATSYISMIGTIGDAVIQAVGSPSNIILNLQGKGLSGVALRGDTSGSTFNPGFVGELFSATVTSASATAFTSASTVNLVSLTLTAGNWDLFGNIGLVGTTVALIDGGISTTSATLPVAERRSRITGGAGAAALSVAIPGIPVNITVSTTYYLVITGSGTGSMSMYGNLYARRRV